MYFQDARSLCAIGPISRLRRGRGLLRIAALLRADRAGAGVRARRAEVRGARLAERSDAAIAYGRALRRAGT